MENKKILNKMSFFSSRKLTIKITSINGIILLVLSFLLVYFNLIENRLWNYLYDLILVFGTTLMIIAASEIYSISNRRREIKNEIKSDFESVVKTIFRLEDFLRANGFNENLNSSSFPCSTINYKSKFPFFIDNERGISVKFMCDFYNDIYSTNLDVLKFYSDEIDSKQFDEAIELFELARKVLKKTTVTGYDTYTLSISNAVKYMSILDEVKKKLRISSDYKFKNIWSESEYSEAVTFQMAAVKAVNRMGIPVKEASYFNDLICSVDFTFDVPDRSEGKSMIKINDKYIDYTVFISNINEQTTMQ